MQTAQHFLLSPAAKTLSLAQVFRMSDEQAEAMFCKVRWPDAQGKPVCPRCGGLDAYDACRANGALPGSAGRHAGPISRSPRARCLTATSSRSGAAIFCNEVKSKSMLAMSGDLGVSYKTASVLCHKSREAMAVELKDRTIGGPGKVAEIDGRYFGGYVKLANLKEHRADRRFAQNQSWTALARIGQRNFSAGCIGQKSGTITTLRARTWRGTLRKLYGGRIAGDFPMANKSAALWGWR